MPPACLLRSKSDPSRIYAQSDASCQNRSFAAPGTNGLRAIGEKTERLRALRLAHDAASRKTPPVKQKGAA